MYLLCISSLFPLWINIFGLIPGIAWKLTTYEEGGGESSFSDPMRYECLIGSKQLDFFSSSLLKKNGS